MAALLCRTALDARSDDLGKPFELGEGEQLLARARVAGFECHDCLASPEADDSPLGDEGASTETGSRTHGSRAGFRDLPCAEAPQCLCAALPLSHRDDELVLTSEEHRGAADMFGARRVEVQLVRCPTRNPLDIVGCQARATPCPRFLARAMRPATAGEDEQACSEQRIVVPH